jgi:ABC-type transport system involved in multi-copper enzyme maturation permease subunit
MNARLPSSIVKCLIQDTVRQAQASGIFWMMLGVTTICVTFCLSVSVAGDVPLQGGDEPALFLPPPPPRTVVPSVVNVLGTANVLDGLVRTEASGKVWLSTDANADAARGEGVDTLAGRLSLAFGAFAVPLGRDRTEAVHYLELLLAWGIADTFGLLLALVWTAGFVPTFLEPSAASVLLAKPIARWRLLLGKYAGVLTFMAGQSILFVFLTWLALGLRTGVWDTTYWWCIPLLLLHFAIFYSFSVLVATATRSTVACVVGSLLFWLLGWGMNYGRVMALGLPETQSLSTFTVAFVDMAYWVSPKPIDGGFLLFNALDAHNHFARPTVFQLLETKQLFSPLLSLLSSLVIACGLLAMSAYEFTTTDY